MIFFETPFLWLVVASIVDFKYFVIFIYFVVVLKVIGSVCDYNLVFCCAVLLFEMTM